MAVQRHTGVNQPQNSSNMLWLGAQQAGCVLWVAVCRALFMVVAFHAWGVTCMVILRLPRAQLGLWPVTGDPAMSGRGR